MENLPPPSEKKEELYLTDYMKKELKGSANWAMFLSISMMAFFGLYLISILSSFSGLPIASATSGLIGIILFLAFLGLILGMGIVLFSFSSNLKKALIQKESTVLIRSINSLSQYFILSFIILIITLLFSFILTLLIF